MPILFAGTLDHSDKKLQKSPVDGADNVQVLSVIVKTHRSRLSLSSCL